MKRIIAIIAALLALAACVKNVEQPLTENDVYPEGAKVTIPFNVAFDAGTPATRTITLGEDTPISDLYVAVFGGSGYLKEYVKAENLTYLGTRQYNDNGVIRIEARYQFTVTLTLAESKRIVHFLGNGPSMLSFGYADDVLPSLLSGRGERAYWHMITLDSGIRARKSTQASPYTDANGREVFRGDFIDNDGNKVVNNQGYVPDQATKEAFQEIPLIKNWAKISLRTESDSNFTPYSYAVVNVPARGAIVPYSSNGFVPDYYTKSFEQLKDMNYTANLPSGTPFDETIPSEDAFLTGTNGVALISDADAAVYIYERPVPTLQMRPSSVIVYGHYDNPEEPGTSGNYYYKVDMMDGDQYYPLFRNIHYEINIIKILSQGHHNPAAAFAAAGSADVSADINARQLADISDGVGRLQVTPWMAHTFTSKVYDGQLQVFFVDNVSNWHVNTVPGDVTVEKLPMANGEADVIETLTQDAPIDDPDDESYGMRTIHFTTVAPGLTARTQTIRITGHYEGGRLYRDVVITVQPVQPMIVRCTKPRIPNTKDTYQCVEIVIPDGLAESMFPLEFWIEPEKMTLTPDNSQVNNNLPVSGGGSISGNPLYAGKPSFHFLRNLDWNEYATLATERDEEDRTWRVLPCHFKSNCDESATTVWVQNEYFIPANASFVNTNDLTFRNLKFTTPIKLEENTEIGIHFDIDEDYHLQGQMPLITMQVYQMEPLGEFTAVEGSPGTYQFTPASSSVDLVFRSTTNEGEQSLSLSADYYEPASIRTHTFQGYGFVDGHRLFKTSGWSNVAYGYVNYDKKKTVLFGYYDDPEAPNAEINLIGLEDCGLTALTPASYPWTPTGPRSTNGVSTYHELEFRTVDRYNLDPIEFTLSANGYVEETVRARRFQGNILTQDQITTNNVLKPGNEQGFSVENPEFTMRQTSDQTPTFTLTFDDGISDLRSTQPQGVILNEGGTYRITVTSNTEQYYMYYVQINFRVNYSWNGKRRNLEPVSWSTTAGEFYKYPGDNKQYIWSLPPRTTSATLTLEAAEEYPINITDFVIKSFKGDLH